MALDKNGIAKRIALELQNNTYVNLGIGIPTLVANHVPKGINVEFQSENGVLGMDSQLPMHSVVQKKPRYFRRTTSFPNNQVILEKPGYFPSRY